MRARGRANTFRLLMAAARTLWFIVTSEQQADLSLQRFGLGTVTRWPQASLTWRGPAVKACRRREFFPYLGFSQLC